MDPLELIKAAGVVGAGGAGFPTHIKLNCQVKYFIVNGVECEPLLKTDQYLMKEKSKELLLGIEAIGKLVKAEEVILGVKKKNIEILDILEKANKELKTSVKIHYLSNFFPAGDEQILVYEVTGKVIPPGGLPLHVGAVVANVGTIVNCHEAIQGKAVTNKVVTVLGEVNNPTLLQVPIGTPVTECIQAAGGPKISDYYCIMGGPMMGQIINQEEIEKRVITKTDGAIILLPKNHYIALRDSTPIKHIINQAKSACIQCRYCTDMCPRYLIGHPLRPHKVMGNIGRGINDEEIMKEALICCECGVCELYACPMGLSPRKVNVYIKETYRQQGIRYQAEETDLKPMNMREYRKIPTDRLISRLNLTKYNQQKIEDLKKVTLNQVSIPLRQHIGEIAKPMVAVGDIVTEGQMIGQVEEGKLGANVHASISGKIVNITDHILIVRGDGETGQ
ncbi:Na+-translocating ferredoxin:NAD+ oxidoreductase RNF, RnfC subunit [Natronincola peptidivorans]|uniref:Na+-translocating ferredoxin:NAD+ oxidoreductase RNF, RnfC subunit n=1 Tax=Natronincola peptidivorans TaxID=426128 RepID=A0A1I0CZM2_9FIRM|nr:4Fe-4S dicluster domain-containing protein [Natronincola peptidivorans]SET25063.1 Na+-translocating ferredoxin:NAD+ oxidoreductase RNF, RnfC subunit [Natronincola peptidivorans]